MLTIVELVGLILLNKTMIKNNHDSAIPIDWVGRRIWLQPGQSISSKDSRLDEGAEKYIVSDRPEGELEYIDESQIEEPEIQTVDEVAPEVEKVEGTKPVSTKSNTSKKAK